MKVFYFCSTGTGPSAVAAAIHLGVLPKDRLPTWQEWAKAKLPKRLSKKDLGKMISFGQDEIGHEICSFGIGRERELIKHSVQDLIKIFNKEGECLLVDTSYAENRFIKWGQRFKGRLGLFLCIKGFAQEYEKIACSVYHVNNELSRTPAPRQT